VTYVRDPLGHIHAVTGNAGLYGVHAGARLRPLTWLGRDGVEEGPGYTGLKAWQIAAGPGVRHRAEAGFTLETVSNLGVVTLWGGMGGGPTARRWPDRAETSHS
jgi:hypothetical protein